MEFMTLKQYADSRNVSYEAVRRQVVKYRKEIADHIIRKDGVQYLDQDAIAFLSEKRRASPLVVVHETNTEKITELEAEIETLKLKLIQTQDEVVQSQKRVIEMQDAMNEALEDKAKYTVLLEDHQKVQTELDQVREELDMTQKKLRIAEIDKEAAKKEAGSYQRSWFGFYRKVD